MPSDIFLRTANVLHRGLLRLSGGRIGSRLSDMPVLALTTTGRKSGLPRKVMLTSPIHEDASLVVVASRGGDDRHPDWYLNLRADPEVEVEMAGEPARPMLARVATPEERADLWPRVTAAYEGYAGYQARTRREIPLVILEPRP